MKTLEARHGVTRWASLALFALALHASGIAEAGKDLGPALAPAQQYALALEAQTLGDYAGMAQWLRAAANGGHAPAQRMLGLALIGGPALYGPAVPANLCEGRHWLLRAARQEAAGAADPAYALFGRPRGDALTAPCEAS
ncbi:sel1 repeat family protein [Achromobacter denitrificans]